MAAAERPLDVVKAPPRSVPQRETTFAAHVTEVLAQHGDVASEAAWQDLSRVIVAHWDELSQSQPPAATWSMLVRATEAIGRLRRGVQQGQKDGAADALEEFRRMMHDVAGEDGEE